HRNVLNVAGPVTLGAVFLLGCFTVGVVAGRSGIAQGLILIYGLGCLIVYLTRPHWLVAIALFLACASLPAELPTVKMIGPVSVYAHQVAVLLAIAFLIPLARLRFSAYVLPGIFLLTVALSAASGVAAGQDSAAVAREASSLCEMVAGFVFALLLVRTNYV